MNHNKSFIKEGDVESLNHRPVAFILFHYFLQVSITQRATLLVKAHLQGHYKATLPQVFVQVLNIKK